jgi:hypothetical protein
MDSRKVTVELTERQWAYLLGWVAGNPQDAGGWGPTLGVIYRAIMLAVMDVPADKSYTLAELK